jgi:dihydrofolate reductase
MGTSENERKLILHMSVSLDGFVAREDGVIDWLAGQRGQGPDQGARRHQANLELLGQIGTIVMGRGGYVDFEKGWSGSDNPMAKLMNSLPKVVFSHSLSEVTWNNSEISRLPLEEEIPALKREPGKDIAVFGGARIAHSLIAQGLIDEYRLTIHPVALGRGLALMLGLPKPQRFEPVNSTAYSDGCVAQVFRPLPAP